MHRNFMLTLAALLTVSFGLHAGDVSLKFTYKGAALCYWDVTLKSGNVTIGKGTTDGEGQVVFSNVAGQPREVNAEAVKKTANGEKKWSVNGYIKLDDAGFCHFDFEPLVTETVNDAGMPASLIETSWGLTLNDCGGSATVSTTSKTGGTDGTVSNTTISASFGSSDTRRGDLEADIVQTSALLHKKNLELQEASDPLEVQLLEAEVDENDARLVMLQLELAVLTKEEKGETVPVMMLQERGIRKAEYDKAREERKQIENEVKQARKTAKKDERAAKPSGIQITKLKTQIKLKERAIQEEEKSFAPSENKLTQLRSELEALQNELNALENN
jgi:hypothetical protein